MSKLDVILIGLLPQSSQGGVSVCLHGELWQLLALDSVMRFDGVGSTAVCNVTWSRLSNCVGNSLCQAIGCRSLEIVAAEWPGMVLFCQPPLCSGLRPVLLLSFTAFVLGHVSLSRRFVFIFLVWHQPRNPFPCASEMHAPM